MEADEDDTFFDADDEIVSAVVPENGWGSRTSLPSPMGSNNFSVWSFLRQCIGKELSKITMPVTFNEPLSFLQRISEYLEYSELIMRADKETNPVRRLEWITAFAVSAVSANVERVGKPFNPVLGETYEIHRNGYKMVCEQVSHHPPISAFHVEGGDVFRFHGSIHPKLRFWGKLVEIQPKGFLTLEMLNHNEVYTWQNVNCNVHNVIIGKLWVEHSGEMRVVNHTNGMVSELTWRPCGWFGRDLHRVDGFLVDSKGKRLRAIYGKWTEAIFSVDANLWEGNRNGGTEPESSSEAVTDAGNHVSYGDLDLESTETGASADNDPLPMADGTPCDLHLSGQRVLWKSRPRPPDSKAFYNFTYFALTMNELPSGGAEQLQLPPTDSRLRSDMRAMEEGDLERAAEEKHRIEEIQRAARREKKRVKSSLPQPPVWFQMGTNEYTEKKDDWFFTGEYWQRDWTKCPQLF